MNSIFKKKHNGAFRFNQTKKCWRALRDFGGSKQDPDQHHILTHLRKSGRQLPTQGLTTAVEKN